MEFVERLDAVLEALPPSDYIRRRQLRSLKRRMKPEPEVKPESSDVASQLEDGIVRLSSRDYREFQRHKSNIMDNLSKIGSISQLYPIAIEASNILFKGVSANIFPAMEERIQLDDREKNTVRNALSGIHRSVYAIRTMLPAGSINKNVRRFYEYLMSRIGNLI